MPEYIINDEGESPGDIPVTKLGLERRFIKSAAGFLASTGAKAIPAFRALAAADVPSHDSTHHDDGPRAMPVVPAGAIGAAAEWIILAGAPDFAQRNGRYGATAFDAAADESIQWLRSVMVPDDYVSSLTIVLIWTNLGAGSGNVVWRISYSVATDGVAFPALTAATDITLTAPAQNVLTYSVITGASPAYTLGGLANFAVARIGTAVADTLANDAGFVALRLRYTADS